MAVKTITIDIEAYGLLSHHKQAGQSFSDVIKAHFKPLPTAGRFRRHVLTVRLPADVLDAVDRVISDRKRSALRVPEL